MLPGFIEMNRPQILIIDVRTCAYVQCTYSTGTFINYLENVWNEICRIFGAHPHKYQREFCEMGGQNKNRRHSKKFNINFNQKYEMFMRSLKIEYTKPEIILHN